MTDLLYLHKHANKTLTCDLYLICNYSKSSVIVNRLVESNSELSFVEDYILLFYAIGANDLDDETCDDGRVNSTQVERLVCINDIFSHTVS